MHLKAVKQVLDESIPDLESIGFSEQTINGTKYTQIKPINRLANAISNLKQIGLAEKDVTVLENYGITRYHTSGPVNFSVDIGRDISSRISHILSVARELRRILTSHLGENTSASVFIKLPPIRDLKELANSATRFDKIFSQTILDNEIGGKIEIKSVDNGSIWLEIFVETAPAVSMIGAMTLAASTAFRQFQRGKGDREDARAKKLNNDRTEHVNKLYNELLDKLLEEQSYDIEEEYFKEHNPERVKRIEVALKMLREEIAAGARIYPSLTAPKEVAERFPDKLLSSAPISQKLIADGENNKE